LRPRPRGSTLRPSTPLIAPPEVRPRHRCRVTTRTVERWMGENTCPPITRLGRRVLLRLRLSKTVSTGKLPGAYYNPSFLRSPARTMRRLNHRLPRHRRVSQDPITVKHGALSAGDSNSRHSSSLCPHQTTSPSSHLGPAVKEAPELHGFGRKMVSPMVPRPLKPVTPAMPRNRQKQAVNSVEIR
jgi:hypothetical protein